MRFFSGLVFIASAFLVACSTDSPSAQVLELRSLAGFRGLAVMTSDYASTGQLHFFESAQKSLGALAVHRDSRLRWEPSTSKLYVIQRMGADSVFSVDLLNGSRSPELPLRRGQNIQDLLPVDANVWVSALDSNSVTEIQWTDGRVLREIQVPTNRVDADGFSEPAFFARQGDTMAATFQRLNSFTVDGAALLMRWSLAGGIPAFTELRFRNPITEIKERFGRFYVGGAGVMGAYDDGGIEILHGTSLVPVGTLIEEATLGGDIVDFEILSEDLAVAVITNSVAQVLAFNPTTGRLLAELPVISGAPYSFVQVLWSPGARRLYLTDQDKNNPRVRVFNEALVELPQETIPLALPPIQIVEI